MDSNVYHRAIRDLLLAACGFFALALLLGVAMRWDILDGALAQHGFELANLRHAHSHAGYYGVLTLAWWIIELSAGLLLSRRFIAIYAGCALSATIAFAFVGYRPPTIALSTIVAGAWLFVGVRHWRSRGLPAWLDAAPFGLFVSVLLVPVIAVMAKRDFAFSRELAHVFITAVLLNVFVPAAWQAQRLARRVPLVAYVPLALAASVRIVFTTRATPLTAAAAIAFAALVAWVVMTEPLSLRAKLAWSLLPIAVAAGSLMPAVQTYAWRIGGLHLLILGPVLGAFFGARVPRVLRSAYVIALGAMVASIVIPERFSPERPPLATALASSVFAAIALLVAAFSMRRDRPADV